MGMSTALLDAWLEPTLTPAERQWLAERCAAVRGGDRKALFLAFSSAARSCGHAPLGPPPAGLTVSGWSADQAARVRLLLALPTDDPMGFIADLDRICATADVDELVAVYQSLDLLPQAPRLRQRASEGIRSSMTAVFRAVALDNPYPARWLDQGAWNQMVLKAVFTGSDLRRVVGLDARANPTLARMAADYVFERWAAKRTIDGQLWRVIGAGADVRGVAALTRALGDRDPQTVSAAALACQATPTLRALCGAVAAAPSWAEVPGGSP